MKIVMKGTREILHHLFKLKPAVMTKNTSWKWKQPTLIELEHAHIYHSIDCDSFEENKYCVPVGGHFHEVKVEYEDNGNIKSMKCGPPLHKVFVKIPGHDNGGIESIEQIQFERHDKVEQMDNNKRWKDEHSHEVLYIDSEILTAKGNASYRAEARDQVKGAMKGRVDNQAAKAQAMQDNAAKVAGLVRES